jgi:hypothetical protein
MTMEAIKEAVYDEVSRIEQRCMVQSVRSV